MAWEKRGGRTYFYRGIRDKGRVKKRYYGTGQLGQFAANADALGRAKRKAAEEALQVKKDLLDVALGLTRELIRGCELLAAATLLTAGFHRPRRHHWRIWRNGRRTLNQPC